MQTVIQAKFHWNLEYGIDVFVVQISEMFHENSIFNS